MCTLAFFRVTSTRCKFTNKYKIHENIFFHRNEEKNWQQSQNWDGNSNDSEDLRVQQISPKSRHFPLKITVRRKGKFSYSLSADYVCTFKSSIACEQNNLKKNIDSRTHPPKKKQKINRKQKHSSKSSLNNFCGPQIFNYFVSKDNTILIIQKVQSKIIPTMYQLYPKWLKIC